jgi:hypothetical protein
LLSKPTGVARVNMLWAKRSFKPLPWEYLTGQKYNEAKFLNVLAREQSVSIATEVLPN